MKKIIVLLIGTILFSFSKQIHSVESKLKEVYSTEICEQILNNPSQKKYFEVFLFHSIVLAEEKEETAIQYEVLFETSLSQNKGNSKKITSTELITLIQSGKINVLQLEIERDLQQNKSYKLGDTNYVLTLLSQTNINNLAKK